MNIIVKTFGSGRIYCRPDTTWERENKDFFSPDGIREYLYTPVLFARISKAGKCIGIKFASRYFDSIGYGMLIYRADQMDGGPMSYASASCMDHTSILPFPMYNRLTLEGEGNIFRILKNGSEIYSTDRGSTSIIEQSLTEASSAVSVRSGDIIAIELAGPDKLANIDTDGNQTNITGIFCENDLFDFKILF